MTTTQLQLTEGTVMPHSNPTAPDAAIERWLKDQIVHFTLETVPLDRVNIRASRDNQARIQPLDEELVERYQRDTNTGTVFPALVAYERAGRLIIIDGNHRHEAMTRCPWVTEVDVYVVEANEPTVLRLTYVANYRNGRPNTDEERLLHAMHLVESGIARNAREAAALLGIARPQLITNGISERKTRERAQALGIRGIGGLGSAAIIRLANVKSDAAFEAATRLAIGAKLSTTEINAIARDINAARSEGAQLRVVEDATELHKTLAAAPPPPGKKHTMPAWGRTKGHLGGILSLTPADVKASCPSPEIWADLQALARTVMEHLAKFDE